MNRYLSQIITQFEHRKNDVFCEFVTATGDVTLTWGDLETRCRQTICSLDKASGERGVALIFLPHCEDIFPVFLGAMLGGYIPSFMPCPSPRQNPALYWQSHQTLIDTIKPTVIVTNHDMQTQMEAAGLNTTQTAMVAVEDFETDLGDFCDSPEDAIAFLQHSSGTTGLKKGVMLSYDAITEHSLAYGKSLKLTDDDVIVSWLPTYHDMGLIACFITPSFHGIKTVQLSAFDWINRPQNLFKLIEKHRGTLCWLPNFAFEHLTNTLAKYAKKFDLSGMRAFINCSEPCKSASFEKFADAFSLSGVTPNQLQCCYAMAETVFGVTQTNLGEAPRKIFVKPESLNRGDNIQLRSQGDSSQSLISTGTCVDGISITIRDEDGVALSDDTIGEITISGKYLFSGYNKDTERTAKALQNGQYKTNDLGFIHQQELYVLGRIDDLIIINGRNIYAHQVEALIANIPGLKPGRSVAISQFDDRVGSEVMVVLAETDSSAVIDEDSIRQSIVQILQSELDIVPQHIEFMTAGELIKTSNGKISRSENSRRYSQRLAAKDHGKAA